MTRETSSRNTAFFAGVAVGALAVASTTSKGQVALADLAALGLRLKGKAGLLAERGARAWEVLRSDPADPHPASGEDLRGKAAGVWQDTRDRAGILGAAETLDPLPPG